MPHIHVYLHNGKVTQDAEDAGTSEGAKKAALTRKQHGGAPRQRGTSAEARYAAEVNKNTGGPGLARAYAKHYRTAKYKQGGKEKTMVVARQPKR